VQEKQNLELHAQIQFAMDYGVHYGQRSILINGTIGPAYVKLVDAALTQMESESDAPITIKINSSGGSVYDALAIIGRIKACKCYIITEGYGQIMSAATVILASGDRRRMSAFAWFMWHEVSTEYEGKVSEIKQEVKQLEIEYQQFLSTIAKFSNKSIKYWKTKGVETDFYMNAKQCKAAGLVEEII